MLISCTRARRPSFFSSFSRCFSVLAATTGHRRPIRRCPRIRRPTTAPPPPIHRRLPTQLRMRRRTQPRTRPRTQRRMRRPTRRPTQPSMPPSPQGAAPTPTAAPSATTATAASAWPSTRANPTRSVEERRSSASPTPVPWSGRCGATAGQGPASSARALRADPLGFRSTGEDLHEGPGLEFGLGQAREAQFVEGNAAAGEAPEEVVE